MITGEGGGADGSKGARVTARDLLSRTRQQCTARDKRGKGGQKESGGEMRREVVTRRRAVLRKVSGVEKRRETKRGV